MANKALRIVGVGTLVAGLLMIACGDGDDEGDGGDGSTTGGKGGSSTGGSSGSGARGGTAGSSQGGSPTGGRGGTAGMNQGGTGDMGGEGGGGASGEGGTGMAGMGGTGMAGAGMGGAGMGGAGMGGAGMGGAGMGGAGMGGAGMGGAGMGGAGMGGAGMGGAGMGGAGMGGAGMGGAGMAGAGMAGMAGAGGGPSQTATGVMRLSLPFTMANQGQRYNIYNRTAMGGNPAMPYDLSGASLTIRVYTPGATGGDLSVFFRSVGGTDTPPTKVAFSTMTAGFVDVTIPVPAASATYNPVMTEIIRMEPESDPAYGSAWLNPTLVVIDSIVSSNGAVNIPFDSTPDGLVFGSSGARALAGTTTMWTAAYP